MRQLLGSEEGAIVYYVRTRFSSMEEGVSSLKNKPTLTRPDWNIKPESSEHKYSLSEHRLRAILEFPPNSTS